MTSARRRDQDVFGRALLDWAHGGTTHEVLERVDGFAQLGAGPEVYLSDYKGWPAAERATLRLLRGRVLDVGCGAGRVTLELQRRGYDVVGLDTSPLAVRAARVRGVKEVWCSPLEDLGPKIARFDASCSLGTTLAYSEHHGGLDWCYRIWPRVRSPAHGYSLRARVRTTAVRPVLIARTTARIYNGGSRPVRDDFVFATRTCGVRGSTGSTSHRAR